MEKWKVNKEERSIAKVGWYYPLELDIQKREHVKLFLLVYLEGIFL